MESREQTDLCRLLCSWQAELTRRSTRAAVASSRLVHLKVAAGPNRYALRQPNSLRITSLISALIHDARRTVTADVIAGEIRSRGISIRETETAEAALQSALRGQVKELYELGVRQAKTRILTAQRVDLLREIVEVSAAEIVVVAQLLVLQNEPSLVEAVLYGDGAPGGCVLVVVGGSGRAQRWRNQRGARVRRLWRENGVVQRAEIGRELLVQRRARGLSWRWRVRRMWLRRRLLLRSRGGGDGRIRLRRGVLFHEPRTCCNRER